MPGPRYLEDLAGDAHTTGSIEVTETEAVAFATRYDPQPMHTDPDAAAEGGVFGGLICERLAPRQSSCALFVDSRPFGETPVLGLGVDELRWPKPLRPGDVINAETKILSITPSQSKPDYAGSSRCTYRLHCCTWQAVARHAMSVKCGRLVEASVWSGGWGKNTAPAATATAQTTVRKDRFKRGNFRSHHATRVR